METHAKLREAFAGVSVVTANHAHRRAAAHVVEVAVAVDHGLEPEEREQTRVERACLLEVAHGQEDVSDAIDLHRTPL